MSVEVGQQAPDFELKNTEDGLTKLSDFRGKKNVLLVFYTSAFSGICSAEFCSLRDDNADLTSNEDVEVLGVSCDNIRSLQGWKRVEGFPITFLADFWPHGAVARQYGVFVEEAGTASRGTFLIDKEGVVRWKQLNAIPDARDQGEWRTALESLA